MKNRLIRLTANLTQTVVGVVLGLILTIGVLVLVSNQPTHQDVYDQQQMILDNQRIVLCLLLYPERVRTGDVLASCQTPTEP